MTKAQHTPGPWKKENGNVLIPVYPGDAGVETLRPILESRVGEAEANARLIAAAPDLLEALETLLAAASGPLEGRSDANDRILDSCRAAIAKARAA